MLLLQTAKYVQTQSKLIVVRIWPINAMIKPYTPECIPQNRIMTINECVILNFLIQKLLNIYRRIGLHDYKVFTIVENCLD